MGWKCKENWQRSSGIYCLHFGRRVFATVSVVSCCLYPPPRRCDGKLCSSFLRDHKECEDFCAINILEDSFEAGQSIDDDFQLLVALVVVVVVADMEI
jgi:hypothetical protein